MTRTEPAGRLCSVPGCGRKFYAKNFCFNCYRKDRKYGNPLEPDRRSRPIEVDEFVEAALSIETRACVDWPFHLDHGGYGSYWRDGARRVHVYVCTKVHGAKPHARHMVRHLCGNNSCINYNHLTWGTSKENAEDKIRHGTQTRGETHYGVVLTGSQVIEIRRIYALGKTSQKTLASSFNVSAGTIEAIVLFRTWKHVPGEVPTEGRFHRLTVQQVQEIRHRFSDGASQKTLSQEFKVSPSHIGRIINGRAWKI